MAQWIKAFAARPDDLSLIPRTYKVEEQNALQAVLWLLCVYCACVCDHTHGRACTHSHTHTPYINKLK